MSSKESCGKTRRGSNGFLFCLAATTIIFFPFGASAQVANFVFVTDPQAIVPGAVSEQITVQAQAVGGTSANVPQTACFSLDTSSAQGQFSSSATVWNPVVVLTMNKNTANRSFYYKDTQEGTHTLTVRVALKPEDESRSCASWPIGEWNISWTATQNITIGTVPASSDSDTSIATGTVQSVSSGNSSGDSVMRPPPTVFADGGGDRTVIVGADTEFRARAYDEKKNIIDFARFHWNFGDGTVSEAATVMHRFEYPGRYVVVLDMPEEKDAVADQIIITVERVELVLSLMEGGGVTIENRAGRTLDLSRWAVRSMGRTFTIPQRTFVLAGSSLRISERTLGFSSGSDVELAYPNGASALGIAPAGPTSTSAALPQVVVSRTYVSRTADAEGDRTSASEQVRPVIEDPAITTSTEQIASTQMASAALSGTSAKWWLGVIGVAGLAAGSLALARRYGKREWDIEEDVRET